MHVWQTFSHIIEYGKCAFSDIPLGCRNLFINQSQRAKQHFACQETSCPQLSSTKPLYVSTSWFMCCALQRHHNCDGIVALKSAWLTVKSHVWIDHSHLWQMKVWKWKLFSLITPVWNCLWHKLWENILMLAWPHLTTRWMWKCRVVTHWLLD